MGFYIQTTQNKNKARIIADNEPSARIVTLTEAARAIDDPDLGVIVVVDNGPFEAAGFCYNKDEFTAFTRRDDLRPRRYVIMDRARAEELTGFPKHGDPEREMFMKRRRA